MFSEKRRVKADLGPVCLSCVAAKNTIRISTGVFRFPTCKHRLAVFLLHCQFRSPLLFTAVICHYLSRDVTTSAFLWKGTHVSEQSSMLQDLDSPWEAWQSFPCTHESNPWTQATKPKQKHTKPLQKPDGSVGICFPAQASYCSYFAQWALIVGPLFREIIFGPPFFVIWRKNGSASLKLQPQHQQPQKRYSELMGESNRQKDLSRVLKAERTYPFL